MNEEVTIVCTRPLGKELTDHAAHKGIRILSEPFIVTEAIDDLEVQQEAEAVSLLETAVIFTSARAVEIVKDLILSQPEGWRIFCIGHRTKEAVDKYFGGHLVVATADDGKELSDKIIEAGIEEAIFFCGEIRMNTIPDTMKRHGIEITEIVVYRTIEVPHGLDYNYAGVMFFSPSAVRSFFAKNDPADPVIMFCIGSTTAEEVKKYCTNRVIVAGSPLPNVLVEEVIEFYT